MAPAPTSLGLRLRSATDDERLIALAGTTLASRAAHPSGWSPPTARVEGPARRSPSLARPPTTPEAWSAGLWGSFA